jgi:hypothetical protein
MGYQEWNGCMGSQEWNVSCMPSLLHGDDDASLYSVDGLRARRAGSGRMHPYAGYPQLPTGNLHTAMHSTQEHRLVKVSAWKELEAAFICVTDQTRVELRYSRSILVQAARRTKMKRGVSLHHPGGSVGP